MRGSSGRTLASSWALSGTISTPGRAVIDAVGSSGGSTYAWDTGVEVIPNAVILAGDWDGA